MAARTIGASIEAAINLCVALFPRRFPAERVSCSVPISCSSGRVPPASRRPMPRQSGRDVAVIEKDPVYVGGISRTVRYKDFLFDIGGHRFFSKSKEVVDLWHEILPDDFIERPRLSRIYYDGKFYSYPLSAFEALRNLGHVHQRRLHAVLRLRQGCSRSRIPTHFHEWVRNQFGERLF